MAEKIVVKAEKKTETGKNYNRRLRNSGRIPVVIYGGGTESVAATAELSDLAAIIRSESGVNTVFSLDIEGDIHDVIFQDRQVDVITGRLLHADLRRFARGEKIEMTVPIHLIGEPAEPLEEGAVVSQALREIKVLCEPAKTPEAIELDISSLTAEHPLHVSDLKVASGAELHEAPETVVASVTIVRPEVLEPSVVEAAEEGSAGEVPGAEEGGEGETQ